MIPAAAAPQPNDTPPHTEDTARTARLCQDLAAAEGWSQLALPILRDRLRDLEASILDAPEITGHDLELLRARRWEIKGFLTRLQEIHAQAQRLLDAQRANEGTPAPPATIRTDAPLDPAYLRALKPQTVDTLNQSLQEELAGMFSPFSPRTPAAP